MPPNVCRFVSAAHEEADCAETPEKRDAAGRVVRAARGSGPAGGVLRSAGMSHEHEYEHVHYDELGNAIVEEHRHSLFAADRRELRSVGIDVGSSTSHLVFSTLELRRQGAALSSRFEVAGRRVDYASPVVPTPFAGGLRIDGERLSAFLDGAYAQAGTRPEEVDTGAVVATGDAARKENAEAIVRLLAERAGDFVCASAGPVLEAKMAAHGSGAVLRSARRGAPATVLNVDVGGGTSKLAVARGGRIEAVAALDVGARLLTFDAGGVVTGIEAGAATCARRHRLDFRKGARADEASLARLAALLAEALLECAAGGPLSPLASELLITGTLPPGDGVDVVLFSGGVAEYFYRETTADHGDLGPRLAGALRERIGAALPGARVERPRERIRATVIGASQFTVQVSGNTIHLGNPGLLPLRGLRAVTADLEPVEVEATAIRDALRERLAHHEVREGEEPFALAVQWPHGPAYAGLRALCEGVAAALPETRRRGRPLVLVLDSDVSRLVGENLSRILGGWRDLLCIDGVQIQDFDYIDIGREHARTHTVTVAIKSLVFSG